MDNVSALLHLSGPGELARSLALATESDVVSQAILRLYHMHMVLCMVPWHWPVSVVSSDLFRDCALRGFAEVVPSEFV